MTSRFMFQKQSHCQYVAEFYSCFSYWMLFLWHWCYGSKVQKYLFISYCFPYSHLTYVVDCCHFKMIVCIINSYFVFIFLFLVADCVIWLCYGLSNNRQTKFIEICSTWYYFISCLSLNIFLFLAEKQIGKIYFMVANFCYIYENRCVKFISSKQLMFR